MSEVKNLIYHGKKPPTKEDASLAKKHLVETIMLEKKKIKEHDAQKKKANKAKHVKSAEYNESHSKEHKKDVKKREGSKRTIDKIWSSLESMRTK